MDTHMNTTPRQSMPVKLYMTADRLVVAAPMAGLLPVDVSIEVTGSGHLIVESRPRGALRTHQLFDVEVTVDRDGDQEVWTREQWQESKEVVLDEWSTLGYFRELALPAAVDATLGTATYGNGILVVALPLSETVRAARVPLGDVRGERVAGVGHQAEKGLLSDMSTIEPPILKDNEFHVSDIPPGSAALVGDAAVFNVDGNFCATQAICTHRGGPLSQGNLEGSTVTCPVHGAQFNVCSGAVLRGPAMDPLTTYSVVVEGDVGRIEAGSADV